MGMFDWYEPQPEPACPRCGQAMVGLWQGKDGPNGLLVWQQGSNVPVDQLVDAGVRWSPCELEGFSLPVRFEIYSECPGGHYVVGECRCAGAAWVSLDLRAYDSLATYVEEANRRI